MFKQFFLFSTIIDQISKKTFSKNKYFVLIYWIKTKLSFVMLNSKKPFLLVVKTFSMWIFLCMMNLKRFWCDCCCFNAYVRHYLSKFRVLLLLFHHLGVHCLQVVHHNVIQHIDIKNKFCVLMWNYCVICKSFLNQYKNILYNNK